MQALAPNYGILLVGRLIVGIGALSRLCFLPASNSVARSLARSLCAVGVGLASMTVPVYVAEVAPPEHRTLRTSPATV